MKFPKIIILILTSCILIFTECSYHCNGFPDDELEWVPFRINDILYYTNNIDTVSIKVTDFYETGPSSFTSYVPIMDTDCPSEAYYLTEQNERLNFSIMQLRNEGCFNYPCKKMELYFSGLDTLMFNDYSVSNDWDSIVYVKYCEDTIIENKEMFDVYLLTKKVIRSEEYIDSVLIAPTYGILQFYDSREKIIWTRIKY